VAELLQALRKRTWVNHHIVWLKVVRYRKEITPILVAVGKKKKKTETKIKRMKKTKQTQGFSVCMGR